MSCNSNRRLIVSSTSLFAGSVLTTILLMGSAEARAAMLDGIFGTSTGTLYRYDHVSNTVTTISSGWGGFDKMVAVDGNSKALFGATASGGTVAVATTAGSSSLATGLGTFQVMSAAGSGAVYGSTTGGGTIGSYDGSAVHAGSSSLGTFYASDGLGNGNAMVSHSSGSGTLAIYKPADASLVQNVVTSKTVNTISGAPDATGNAWYGVNADQKPYFWDGSTSTGISSGWGSITQLSAMSSNRAAMFSTYSGGTATILSQTGYPHYETGWGGMTKLVSLTDGHALGGSTYNGGIAVLYNPSLSGNASIVGVGGSGMGTFQQMIALDNGFAVFGSDPTGGDDGQNLASWDGDSLHVGTTAGGWGTFQLLVDLGDGDVLVGTDKNGGTLYLFETVADAFGTVTTIGTGYGNFQQGVGVVPVPEPASGMLLAWAFGYVVLWCRRRRD